MIKITDPYIEINNPIVEEKVRHKAADIYRGLLQTHDDPSKALDDFNTVIKRWTENGYNERILNEELCDNELILVYSMFFLRQYLQETRPDNYSLPIGILSL